MEPEIQAELKKLSKLQQFKNAEESVLLKQAEKNVTLRKLVEEGNFISQEEKKLAKSLFDGFLKTHEFESLSDLNTLSMLIFNMVVLGRIQVSLNECSTKDGGAYIPDKLIKSMHEVETRIDELKIKLGIDRKDQQEDEMTALQLLKRRFAEHIQLNRNEFSIAVPFKCPSCQHEDVKMVLLRRRVADFEALDNPHFAGRFWMNEEAIKLVKSGVLTKEQYAKIFSTSIYFVDYCLAHEGKILGNQKTEEKV